MARAERRHHNNRLKRKLRNYRFFELVACDKKSLGRALQCRKPESSGNPHRCASGKSSLSRQELKAQAEQRDVDIQSSRYDYNYA